MRASARVCIYTDVCIREKRFKCWNDKKKRKRVESALFAIDEKNEKAVKRLTEFFAHTCK